MGAANVRGFRRLQEGGAVQGDILPLADQQLPQQAAGDILSPLLEPTATEIPDNAEHRGPRLESECERNQVKLHLDRESSHVDLILLTDRVIFFA